MYQFLCLDLDFSGVCFLCGLRVLCLLSLSGLESAIDLRAIFDIRFWDEMMKTIIDVDVLGSI